MVKPPVQVRWTIDHLSLFWTAGSQDIQVDKVQWHSTMILLLKCIICKKKKLSPEIAIRLHFFIFLNNMHYAKNTHLKYHLSLAKNCGTGSFDKSNLALSALGNRAIQRLNFCWFRRKWPNLQGSKVGHTWNECCPVPNEPVKIWSVDGPAGCLPPNITWLSWAENDQLVEKKSMCVVS